MYLPNIIPSDIRTGWMQAPSEGRLQASTRNDNSNSSNNSTSNAPNLNVSTRGRKSEFPPLSFYTPVRAAPLFLNNVSKTALSLLKNSKKPCTHTNRQESAFEGIEQLGLELGCRLQKLKENEVWGYTWLTPLGLDKTMAQMLEEANDEVEDIEEDNEDVNLELQNDINGASNDMEEMLLNSYEGQQGEGQAAVQNTAIQDATDLMTENLGQMRRNENEGDSFNDNINSRASNENDLGNQAIYANTSGDVRLLPERDLDADISNYDSSHGNYSNVSIYRGNDNYYDDEEEMHDVVDHAYIAEDPSFDDEDVVDDVEENDDDEDDDEDYEIGDHAIVDLQDDDENEEGHSSIAIGNHRNEILGNVSRTLLHSSFHEDAGAGAGIPIGTAGRRFLEGEEQYFMAYEDYQEDHSIIEGQVGKPYPSRGVSILESAHTRGSGNSVRRNINTGYTDSANLTTPTTINSSIGNQTTGNTSVDNDIHGSDFDMTLE